ncbi:coiled-coil domain-containing protein 24 isoform 1-T3 [Leptodactylus fuscus]|uniref:coiled-coil domain-containing protein 24 isoform X1 n=1 Tax=Leptodactylus fuscus TaxID=238119 RepID=UPI003F4E5158
MLPVTRGHGDLLEPPPSLWRLVEDLVPRSERPEIRRILGDAAVELSLDLHTEIEVLLDLWRDLRSIPRPPSRSGSVLSDPPAIKDLVTQEIRLLLLSVRAQHRGRDKDQALCKYNPKVVNYVMGRPESGARSARSGWSRPSSGCRGNEERALSSGSCIDGSDLEELKDKLQISHIDEVISHLRSLLEDERRTLEKDIMTLQLCLEEEHQYGEELQILEAEPSLTELKAERRILERDLHLQQVAPSSVQTSKMALGGGRLSQRSPDLQQRPPRTPCPPHLKGRGVRKGLSGPGATASAAAAASPVKSLEEPGPSLEQISRVYRGRGQIQAPPISYELTPAVTPGSALLFPLPPKVQRATGSPSPAFRRVPFSPSSPAVTRPPPTGRHSQQRNLSTAYKLVNLKFLIPEDKAHSVTPTPRNITDTGVTAESMTLFLSGPNKTR